MLCALLAQHQLLHLTLSKVCRPVEACWWPQTGLPGCAAVLLPAGGSRCLQGMVMASAGAIKRAAQHWLEHICQHLAAFQLK